MADTFAIEGVGLTRRYGGFAALDAVRLAVPDGEIRGLIGPNGAGKSTLIDVLSGRAENWQGTVRLRGGDISGLSVQERRRSGLARSFQRTNIFPELAVREQLEVASWHAETPNVDEVLHEMGLAGIAHMRAADISYGDRRRLDLALAGAGPLLGEGELGASVYPDGIRRPFWYRDGQAGFGEYVQLRVVAPHRLRDAAAPLAVLLGPRTASSAEVLAAAARGRPHARSFGAPTRGVSAGNRTFELSDHAAVVLTVAATADRTGRADLGPLEPDERVAASYRGESVAASDRAAVERAHDGAPTEASRPRIGAESGAPADPVVAVATAWLATQDTCR